MPDALVTGQTYDVVVVGAGAAGVGVVEEAWRRGLHVALVDHMPSLRVHETLWTELLQSTGSLWSAFDRTDSFASTLCHGTRELWRRIASVDRHLPVCASLAASCQGPLETFEGPGRVVSNSELELSSGQRIRAQVFVIAVGSDARRPARFEFDGRGICDSHSILRDPIPPRSVLIVGADWSGCEWSFICASAGAEVTVIDRRTRLLRALDAEVRLAVQKSLHEMGITIALGEQLGPIERGPHGSLFVQLGSGRVEVVDKVLVLAGEVGNTAGLGLSELGVDLDWRGYVAVDDHFRSSVDGIYAVGPVTDPMGFAPSPRGQAYVALGAAMGEEVAVGSIVPWVLRTLPEVGTCGMGEEACAKLDIPVVVGRASEAQKGSPRPSLARVVVGVDDRRILGAQLVGPGAPEAVHLAAESIDRQEPLEASLHHCCAEHTSTELYWRAARAALNQIQEVRGLPVTQLSEVTGELADQDRW